MKRRIRINFKKMKVTAVHRVPRKLRKLRKIEEERRARETDKIRKTIKRISKDRIQETIENIIERTKESQYTIMVTAPNGVTQPVLVSDFYAQKSKEWKERINKASFLKELQEVEKEIEALNF